MNKKIMLVALFTLFCNATISAKSIWKKAKNKLSSKQTTQVFSNIGSVGVGSSMVANYIDQAHKQKTEADSGIIDTGLSGNKATVGMKYNTAIKFYIRALQAMDIYGRPAGQPSRNEIWDHIAQCLHGRPQPIKKITYKAKDGSSKTRIIKSGDAALYGSGQIEVIKDTIHSDGPVAGATASSRVKLMNKEANAMCEEYHFNCSGYFS